MQEELDQIESGPKHRSLVDDVIDDSFVDVPLDDISNFPKPQDQLDVEIRRLEQNYSQTNSIGAEMNYEDQVHSGQSVASISQSIPTIYENNEHNYDVCANEQPFFGLFEPFKIKPTLNKVRTLSELNQMDLASRGVVIENTGKSNDQSKPKGRTKAKRRPNKSARQRMKRKAASYDQPGKDWQMVQGNMESFGDDYKQTPMEVETDSTGE